MLLLLITACEPPIKKITGRKLIVTTTGILADAVRHIVKDSAQVEALMGPGVDPHLYKASHRDVNLLTEGDIIFYNGLHLEGKMQTVLEKVARHKTVIAVTSRIPLTQLHPISEATNIYDPHIWFDVPKFKQCVRTISETLQQEDPDHRDYYRLNEQAYQAQLDSLHHYIQRAIESIPPAQRVLITAHDAFGYFGQAYHIRVRGLQGISTLSDYGLKDVADLVDFITQHKIKSIFVETSISQKSIEAVVAGCRARGHKVTIGGSLYSDALGAPGTQPGTYIGMVKHNVNIIVNSLK